MNSPSRMCYAIWFVLIFMTQPLFQWRKPEPDPEVVLSIKADEVGQGTDSKMKRFNPTGRKMVLKLPGVTEKNVEGIMQNCDTFLDLCQKFGTAEFGSAKKVGLLDADVRKIRNFCDKNFKSV